MGLCADKCATDFVSLKREGFVHCVQLIEKWVLWTNCGWVGVGFAMHVIHSCLETVLEIPTVKLQLMW